jgi:hypothetical protein
MMRLVQVVFVLVALLVAAIVCTYLTEYGATRFVLAAVVCACGVALAVGVSRALGKLCHNRKRRIAAAAGLAVLLLSPGISMFASGRVTYARFGLTVYGLIPIPMLDITVGAHGGLGFRDKSHFISLGEVRPLLSSKVQVLVIGTGWDGMVQVDPAITNSLGIEVHILRTPQAFELFNRFRSEGRRVVLVAHSTC